MAKRFVVIGTQRTGTTLMVTALNSHPQIQCFGELFKQRRPKGLHPEGESAYWLKCQESWRWRLSDVVLRHSSAANFLDDVLSVCDEQAAVGFKLMLSQIKRFHKLSDLITARQYNVLHVVRNNVLKTYVSRLAARQRGYYHSDKSAKIEKINISTNDLESQLHKIHLDEIKIEETFKNKGPYLQVAYEEFQYFDETVVSSLLQFLGVPQFEIGSSLKKQSSDDLMKVIDNYEEVADCIQRTSWAQCLNF